eukprot:jgi/Psemu1/20477/gm1.20477_g
MDDGHTVKPFLVVTPHVLVKNANSRPQMNNTAKCHLLCDSQEYKGNATLRALWNPLALHACFILLCPQCPQFSVNVFHDCSKKLKEEATMNRPKAAKLMEAVNKATKSNQTSS